MEALGLFIGILLFSFFMWACLKVASDADDAIEEMMKKKGKKK